VTRDLREALRIAATAAVDVQHPDGSFPAGHNGPYRDPETPVRNTAHWLVTLCDLYRETGHELWGAAAHRAADYLLGEEARPAGASFFCRTNPSKDRCNGVMGQAWAIEGLIAAARALGREDADRVAKEVFFLHPFREEQGVWERVEVDGSHPGPDRTFNHQLWFAAIGGQLGDEEAGRRALHFLKGPGTRVETYRDGIICHGSRIERLPLSRSSRPRDLMLGVRSAVSRWRSRRVLWSKSVGYHAFNLYAYALLKQRFPAEPFWRGETMTRMLAVTLTPTFKRDLDDNPYGYPYNPPGIELALAGEVFGLDATYCREWIAMQVARTLDHRGSLLTRGVPDRATSAARIYEATRLVGSYALDLHE
jgi:hypothetical protein